MTTEFEAPGSPASVPTLPPPVPPSAASSDTDAPFLPSAVPTAPATSTPIAFDAKAMVESQRRKVENPVYGQMPTGTGTPEGKAASEAARKAMRKRRRRNKLVGRVVGVVFLGAVAAAGYYGYKAFQADQDKPSSSSDQPASGAIDPAGATPLGQQVEVVEALDEVNSGATPAAGGLMEAVADAEQAVGQTNANAAGQAEPAPISVSNVAPPEVLGMATAIDPLNGFDRWVIDVDQALYTQRRPVTDWLNALRSLPQAPAISDPALLPNLSSGQLLLAVQSADGVVVDRLVVVGPDQGIQIDAP